MSSDSRILKNQIQSFELRIPDFEASTYIFHTGRVESDFEKRRKSNNTPSKAQRGGIGLREDAKANFRRFALSLSESEAGRGGNGIPPRESAMPWIQRFRQRLKHGKRPRWEFLKCCLGMVAKSIGINRILPWGLVAKM